ncbi:alpha-N-acetylglucosaminidase N-terminal domain-containing protein [Streptomyces sp. HM190]|uniref:alpha-N-acetylglucosaminidase N-terminal domain-containing protein n=1 Tax=Streptomyces sp. HM190 TaxID=2695266 RepID=UPI0013574928|nr:alpha-N-acetylglucosaminidase N-terminal domain-containing protein [Streptomyces sp. HM190]
MSSPSRRTVPGSAGAIGLGAFLEGSAPAHAAESPGGGPVFDTAPARSALNRPLPGHAGQFRLSLLDRDGTVDRFRVTGATGRVRVRATTPAALLVGVHGYLTYVCGAHLARNAGPRHRPAPARPPKEADRELPGTPPPPSPAAATGRSGPTPVERQGDHLTIRSFC